MTGTATPKVEVNVNIGQIDAPKVSMGGNVTGGKYNVKTKAYKYSTGGINTQTGPAWLDGSLSEPEYVLNARQTEAFLRLADVLPAAMSNSNSSVSNTFGSNYINFAINVDKIDSDYSVDQMVDRIKDKLFSDASYRNVNTLSFIR
jgi:hypothetical protein